jgi:hypothetical protein
MVTNFLIKNSNMKKLIFVIAVTAFCISANAQDTSVVSKDTYMSNNDTHAKKDVSDKKFIVSLGIEPSIPIGHFNDYSGFGFGGYLQGEIKPVKSIGITLNAGYIDYFGKTVNGLKNDDFKYWPVLGGLKLYMSKNSYVHAQSGAGFGTNGLGTSFWYGAGVGFNLGRMMDAEIKYTGWKQNQVSNNNGGTQGTPGYVPPQETPGGTPAGTPGYGGHYSTIDLTVAVKF